MPYRLRENGSWLIDFRANGTRYRKTVKGSLTKREVASLERHLRVEAEAAGARRRSRRATFRDLAERYWNEHAQHLGWAVNVRSHLNRWADAIGDDTPAMRIDASEISSIVGEWRKADAPATINRRLAVLRAIWYRAADLWGMKLTPIPWRRLTMTEPAPKDRSLSPAERARILAALPTRSLYPALFALATGLRRSAVLRITRADLDSSRGVVRTISKGRAGGKETIVPMTESVLAILTAMGQLPEVGAIFRLSVWQLRDDIAKAREIAGLPGFTFHRLRHSFAQDLEDAGSGEAITAALHHSTPALRQRYAKARMDRLREVIERAQRR